jgi:branched-chain amino acid transport system permease protein
LPRWAFNTAIWLVMRNEEWLTGGTFGINNIARPSLFGYSLEGNLAYYYFVLAVTLMLAGLLWGAAALALGQGLHGAARQPDTGRKPGREHPQLHAAELCHRRGVCRYRGRIVCLAGAVHRAGPFNVAASIMMYLMVVVGGAGYFFGPVIGAAVGVVLPEWLR